MVRKCGSPPAGPRDGERIAASLDQAVDSGLREDQVYHYAIYAIYRMADLRRYPSQGIVVAAFPLLPPPPMNAPRLMIMPSGQEWCPEASPKGLSNLCLRRHESLSMRQSDTLRWIQKRYQCGSRAVQKITTGCQSVKRKQGSS